MRWIGRIAIGLALLLALLTGAFLALGGVQLVRAMRGPDLPTYGAQASLASDLRFLREAVLRNERGATPAQFDGFLRVIDGAPPLRSVDELTLIASEALAQFDNAHTTLMRPMMRRLPIRLHWTADALIVVKARPVHSALLGRRIVAIGGRTPEELAAGARRFVGGGTPGWVRYRSEYFLTAPAALTALGAEAAGDSVELRVRDQHGAEEYVTLAADLEPLPGDPFWDFLNAFPGDTHFETDGWATLLRADQTLPLYLQEPRRFFLARALPEQSAVYLRMNSSANDEGETVAQFTTRALALVRERAPRNIIVDFRYNRGGGYDLVLPLVEGVASALPANGRVYVITGPNTFSAGLIAASQFRRWAGDRLTIVGEDVGDRLRFRGEGVAVTLPASGVEAYLATAWDDVASDCGLLNDCWPLNRFLLRGIGAFAPDIRAANTWESYRAGRDLVLDAVLADISARAR